ncbi:Preprotein translocase subunit SecY [Buchnera aphidicola (Eriosoma grossulariae)]|uniref:preprotein translocase subunit SecY n=1 Tax=Buchnera aphidicola TaxID=9 RepID=UPI0034640295
MDKKIRTNHTSVNHGLTELKKRLYFVILSLLIFRIGAFIPIPGINTIVLSQLIDNQKGTIIEMFNMFSGGALSRASVFSLGIMPYISASIILQVLTLIYPKFKDLKKEGEIGRQKINQYTRYTTLFLALLQSIGIATSLPFIPGMQDLVINPNFNFYFLAVLSLVTGTIFLMWLGELITECGVGNGISIIIFAGILVGFPGAVGNTLEEVRKGNLNIFTLCIVLLLIFLVTFLVVFIERSQRNIVVHYARKQQGRRMYISNNTYLPLKVNMSGVIPAIFSSSLMLFPATITSWLSGINYFYWLSSLTFYFQPNQPVYLILYVITIIFFCFFYTELVFNPRETADNLKKSGAFIPGIRPGEKTAKYINKIMLRLILINALYITFICLIPEFLRSAMNVPFYFGGTSLLIVVVVIMDFIVQLQTLIMSNQYDSILKKSNFNF